jgi:hypothetical protein
MELGKGAGLGSFKAGFSALHASEFLVDAFLVEAEAVIAVAVAIFAVVLSFVVSQALIGDGGFDSPSAAHAPLGHGDVLDEVEFEDGSGLERLDIVLL